MAAPRKDGPARRGLGPRGWGVLVVLVGALVAWVYVGRRAQKTAVGPVAAAPRSILQHIPPGAMLVARVDVAALRNTELGKQFLGQGRNIAGLGEVAALCGGDPMDAVDTMAIAIPDAMQDTGFGLFASGRIVAHELIGCAETIVRKRGGRPVKVPAGRFTLLKDASLALSSAELAAADGGPVILAEPAYVRAALGTVGSKSLHDDAAHAALRGLVPDGQLVATVVLTAEQRKALLDELRAQDQADSPFRAVSGAALAMSVGDELDVAVALRCDDAQLCASVGEHLRTAASEQAQTMAAQAVGLSDLLTKLEVQARGPSVHARVRVPSADALLMLRRAIALRKLANGPLPPQEGPNPIPQAPPPDVDAGAPDPDLGDAGVRIEAPSP